MEEFSHNYASECKKKPSLGGKFNQNVNGKSTTAASFVSLQLCKSTSAASFDPGHLPLLG